MTDPTTEPTTEPTLTPIREVADRFALPVSTLHYWERRGLVTPHRRSGHRYFDTGQLYRVALIKLWRETGQMSIAEIGTLLRRDDGPWQETVRGRVAALEEQMARLETARAYLNHLLTCAHEGALETCSRWRATVTLP